MAGCLAQTEGERFFCSEILAAASVFLAASISFFISVSHCTLLLLYHGLKLPVVDALAGDGDAPFRQKLNPSSFFFLVDRLTGFLLISTRVS